MIIGISGKAQHGKDTVGTILQYLSLDSAVFAKSNADILADLEYAGYTASKSDWQIKKYAYKLKQIASILLNIPVEHFDRQEVKEMELPEMWWYWSIFKTSQRVPYLGNENFDLCDISCTLIKPTVRVFLQELGTDAMREVIHPETWVNALMSEYQLIDNKYPNWIITDVRFPNEYRAIKERGGIMIRVHRNLFSYDTHPSETALDDYDFDLQIYNHGTLEDLITEVMYKKPKLEL